MIELYHDYADPLCFLVELRLLAIAGGPFDLDGLAGAVAALPVVRRPFELRPPPGPMGSATDPDFLSDWRLLEREAAAYGLELTRPTTIPWTRKAHELVAWANERGSAPAVHAGLLWAGHVEGLDLGRIDLLVAVASAAGLPGVEARVSLDVDRYSEEVARATRTAERSGVVGVPTLLDPAGRALGNSIEELRGALREPY